MDFCSKKMQAASLFGLCKLSEMAGKYLSPLLSSVLTSLALEKEETEILTMREREVLKLLAEGKRTKEIAEALYISPYTVRRHRSNIMEKLNIKNLADLVKYAISQNYIPDHS